METLEDAEDDEEKDKETSGEEQLAQTHFRLHHWKPPLTYFICPSSKLFLPGHVFALFHGSSGTYFPPAKFHFDIAEESSSRFSG